MPDDAPRVEELQRLGKQLLDGGEPEAARIVLEKCLPLAEAQQNTAVVVSVLGMLAACHTRLLQFGDAASVYERAVRIADDTLEPDHPVRVIVIRSWAAFARSRGALNQEKRLWEKVLPVLAHVPRFEPFLRECSRCLQEIETLAPEERQLRESLETARTAEMSTDGSFDQRVAFFQAVQRPAQALAELLKGMGRHREWSATVRDGLMMRPAELWRTLTSINAPYRPEVLDEQRCRFNLFVLQALQNPRPEAAQTALEALVWRRGIGLEIHRCANRLARRDVEARRILDTLQVNRANYAAMFLAAPSDADLRPSERMKTKIVLEPIERNFEYQASEMRLLERLSEVNRFVSRPADCAELASQLPDDGVLIEYWRCTWPGDPLPRSSYVAVVLPRNRPDMATVVHLCESAAFEDTLLEYLSLLSGRSKDADFGNLQEVAPDPVRARVLGQTIRELVLDPLKPWTARGKHLLLVTDGLLSRLPFAALPLDEGYVLDQWLISYLHSSRDLFASDDAPKAAGPPLVISDPAYDWPGSVTRGTFHFERLGGAAEEADAIASMLSIKPLASTEATKEALLTCACPEILHIATHGMMLPAKPSIAELGPLRPLVWREAGEARLHIPGVAVLVPGMERLSNRQLPDQALRSILALAGVNTWLVGDSLPPEAGNGLMTAEDIAAMDLAGNKLTVLSACETGLGVIGVGEGVLGLGSSFGIAGAETVVMSLWSADDVTTKDLMRAFYQRLLTGTGRAKALQDAQQAIREQYPDDPFYWSAFICQGASGPMRETAA